MPRPVLDLPNLPDADVVSLAQRGNEGAFRELIRRYERPVFSLIYRMVLKRLYHRPSVLFSRHHE